MAQTCFLSQLQVGASPHAALTLLHPLCLPAWTTSREEEKHHLDFPVDTTQIFQSSLSSST